MLFVVGQLGRHYFEAKGIDIDINFQYYRLSYNDRKCNDYFIIRIFIREGAGCILCGFIVISVLSLH